MEKVHTRHPDALGEPRATRPNVPVRGRVVAMVDEHSARLYKMRVPRNGLWWVDEETIGGPREHPELGCDDIWVEDDGHGGYLPLNPVSLGDWVEALGSDVRRAEPLQVKPTFERVNWEGVEADAKDGAPVSTVNLRFPDVPWLDEWFSREQSPYLGMRPNAFSLSPDLLGCRRALFLCGCAEPACGSIHARVEDDPHRHRVVWQQVSTGIDITPEHVGPSLAFDREWYLGVPERIGPMIGVSWIPLT